MCTRVLWNDNDLGVLCGRTMDWPESTEPVLTVAPRGYQRHGGKVGPLDVVLAQQIDGQGQYLQPGVPGQQGGAQLFQTPGPPGQKNKHPGPRRELHRKLTADPRRGAGDQDSAIIDRSQLFTSDLHRWKPRHV